MIIVVIIIIIFIIIIIYNWSTKILMQKWLVQL